MFSQLFSKLVACPDSPSNLVYCNKNKNTDYRQLIYNLSLRFKAPSIQSTTFHEICIKFYRGDDLPQHLASVWPSAAFTSFSYHDKSCMSLPKPFATSKMQLKVNF